MHENNNEVCSESFTFPPNWMKYFENYKYKCLYCKQKAALVRKYDSQPPCRIFSVFNKGSYFVRFIIFYFLYKRCQKKLCLKFLLFQIVSYILCTQMTTQCHIMQILTFSKDMVLTCELLYRDVKTYFYNLVFANIIFSIFFCL